MWEIDYYEKENGNIPVVEFLDSLPNNMSAKTLRTIDLLASAGTALKEPYVKHIEGPIWELRTQFGNDITRVFYFASCGNRFVLLHGFLKKTQKTPPREKKLAKTYYEDYERRFLIK